MRGLGGKGQISGGIMWNDKRWVEEEWEEEEWVKRSGMGWRRILSPPTTAMLGVSAKSGAKDLRVGELSGRSTKAEEMRRVGSCLTQK